MFSVKPVFTVSAGPGSTFHNVKSLDAPVCKHGRHKRDIKQEILNDAAKEEQLKILRVTPTHYQSYCDAMNVLVHVAISFLSLENGMLLLQLRINARKKTLEEYKQREQQLYPFICKQFFG